MNTFTVWRSSGGICKIGRNSIPQCVKVIKTSFITVADQFGFTVENAPRFTAFATTDEKLFSQYDKEQRPMYAYYSEVGRMVGYYSLLRLENGECELNNLCVLPEHRHRRIGAELLCDAFERAKGRGCTKVIIGIVEENRVLRKWYEENGFVHTGTKKFDFFPFTCGYMEREI